MRVTNLWRTIAFACYAAALLPAIVPAPATAGGTAEFTSAWAADTITVDGSTADWNDRMCYLEDMKGVINVCNDDRYLYVSLLSGDREIMRQIMMSGLTLWFDPANGKQKKFGFRFRTGMGRRPTPPRDGDSASPGVLRPGSESSHQKEKIDEAEIQKRFAERMENMKSFEIIGPDTSRNEIPMTDSTGVEAQTGFFRGAFVYEIKVPLARTDGQPFGVDAAPGGTIAIGIESPKFKRKAMGRGGPPGGDGGNGPSGGGMDGGRGGGMGGGPPGGGIGGGRGSGMGGGPPRGGMRGGRGGGMGGGPGRRPAEDEVKQPEPFEVWVTVKLASSR